METETASNHVIWGPEFTKYFHKFEWLEKERQSLERKGGLELMEVENKIACLAQELTMSLDIFGVPSSAFVSTASWTDSQTHTGHNKITVEYFSPLDGGEKTQLTSIEIQPEALPIRRTSVNWINVYADQR